MHVQTHVMSGWCLGNCWKLSPRERLFCMLAASLADLDGLSLLVSREWYWDYHHKLCHNLLFGLIVSVTLTLFSKARWKTFWIYLGLFHLHLVLDYFGSGPDWEIYYFWPFSSWSIWNPQAWPFYSWQNFSVALAFLVWVIAIAVRLSRTPLEIIMPSLDIQLVNLLRRWFG